MNVVMLNQDKAGANKTGVEWLMVFKCQGLSQ